MTEHPTYDELLRLHAQHDGLTPTIVLDAARTERSPLHSLFEWNDDRAGEQYRLIQARHLIGRFRIKVVNPNESEQSLRVRAFHLLPDEGKWRSAADVMSSPDRIQSVLAVAVSELRSFRRKYEALLTASQMRSALLEVFDALDPEDATP
jgi:hypothetical protein